MPINITLDKNADGYVLKWYNAEIDTTAHCKNISPDPKYTQYDIIEFLIHKLCYYDNTTSIVWYITCPSPSHIYEYLTIHKERGNIPTSDEKRGLKKLMELVHIRPCDLPPVIKQ